jgi:hypothetical protein
MATLQQSGVRDGVKAIFVVIGGPRHGDATLVKNVAVHDE